MELNQCDIASNDFCKRLLSFAAGHDNDIGKIQKEINAIKKVRINENRFCDKVHEDEFLEMDKVECIKGWQQGQQHEEWRGNIIRNNQIC